MARLSPEIVSPTAAAIFARHERDAEDWRRAHLGASVVGHDCGRWLWYSFRWAAAPRFPGRMLRLFERGKREEAWVVEELRALGWQVLDVDPATGEQWTFSELGGHFGGSADAAVLGVIEAPKTWHLLEVKTSNAKGFAALRRDGVRKAKPQHWAQMQALMGGLGLERALYLCACKDDDDVYAERIRAEPADYSSILARATRAVHSAEPLPRISDDPSWFQCKTCHHADHCHLGLATSIERNCRTCASSTPMPDGTWRCDHFGKALSVDEQRAGCEAHLFVPALLGQWQPEHFDAEARAMAYVDRAGAQFVDRGRELRPA